MEEELIPFNTACEEFMNGKFIFPENKIALILKTLENNEKLKNIVSSALVNYNFNDVYQAMVENNSFVLPDSNKELIAFVYCLLFNFQNKNLPFNAFISKIKTEPESNGFAEFCSNFFAPFKETINAEFLKQSNNIQVEEVKKSYFQKLMTAIEQIFKNIDNFKLKMAEKEEFSMLLNSLYLACEKNDKKLVYSLMVGLDYFTKAFKKTRNAYYSLEECFTN